MSEFKLPVKRKTSAYVVTREASTENMVNDAMSILGEQLEKLKLKSRSGTFDVTEADLLKTYIKSLCELSREEREITKQAQENDLSKLTNEQLLELAQAELQKAAKAPTAELE